jgi:hypothetical protein
LTSCNSNEEKKRSLDNLIVGDWQLVEIQLNSGIAKIDLYHLIPGEYIPGFQFTDDKRFTIYNNEGISYISGDYDLSSDELILSGRFDPAGGVDSTLHFPVQTENNHQITITGDFRTHFLALIQKDSQVAGSLRLTLNILANIKDAKINLVLQRQ